MSASDVALRLEAIRRRIAAAALRVDRRPEDITLVVAGGGLPIAQQAYLPTWGFPACRIHRVIPPPTAGRAQTAR